MGHSSRTHAEMLAETSRLRTCVLQAPECEFRVEGLGCGVWVQGAGCMGWSSRFGFGVALECEFRVVGLGCGVWVQGAWGLWSFRFGFGVWGCVPKGPVGCVCVHGMCGLKACYRMECVDGMTRLEPCVCAWNAWMRSGVCVCTRKAVCVCVRVRACVCVYVYMYTGIN